MVYKDKLWIKFNGLDIECFCTYDNRKCPLKEKECHVYLAKFIRLDDVDAHDERVENLREGVKRLEARIKNEQKKFESEIKRSIKKFKI